MQKWLQNLPWTVFFDDLGAPQAFIEIKYKVHVNLFQKYVKKRELTAALQHAHPTRGNALIKRTN